MREIFGAIQALNFLFKEWLHHMFALYANDVLLNVI